MPWTRSLDGDFAGLAAGQAAATANEASNLLVEDEGAVVASFVNMAARTLNWLSLKWRLSWFRMDTSNAFSGVVQILLWNDVPPHIARRWSEWRPA